MNRYKLSNQAVAANQKVNMEIVAEWMQYYKSKIQSFFPKDIVNPDKTGLRYHCTPNQSVAFKRQKCHGRFQSKERVTVLLCRNMECLQKLKCLVIGKSA